MSSSDIWFTPADARRFARELTDLARKLKAEERQLHAEMQELGKTWQDKKYRLYKAKLEETSRELASFYKDAERFIRFLDRKAVAAEKFLG